MSNEDKNKARREKAAQRTPEQKQVIAERQHAYYEKTKAARKEYCRAYNERNKERLRLKRQAYTSTDAYREQARQCRKDNPERFKQRNRTHGRRFSAAKSGARDRGFSFEMTFDQWRDVVKDNTCHYCGKPLSETGSGLDRKNNEPYYRVENVVPCCGRCNVTFNALYTYEGKMILARAIRAVDALQEHHDGCVWAS